MLKLLLHKATPFLPGYTTTAISNALIVALCVIKGETACLNKLKRLVGAITGTHATAATSHYRRLIRFFRDYSATSLWIDLIACGLRLLRLKSDYLILDGTSWQRPGRWCHLLTLCVVYKGVAIPIVWIDLAKKGTSNFAERKRLFELAFEHYDLSGRILLADREYIGREWLEYLSLKGLGFVIRSRDYAYFSFVDTSGPGQPRLREAIRSVESSGKPNRAKRFAFRFDADGPLLWYVIARNPDPRAKAKDRVMLLITTLDESPYATVERYLLRWKIEHCFRQLKSNGFKLELVNLGDPERRRLLIAVVVFAYILSVIEGLATYATAVPMKPHGSDKRRYKAASAFRHGADQMGEFTVDLVTFVRYLVTIIRKAMSGYRSSYLLNV